MKVHPQETMRPTFRSLPLLCVTALLALAPDAVAVETQLVTYDTAEEFASGELVQVSLTPEPRLVLAPEHSRRALLDVAAVWAVAAHGDALYAATGSDGRVYRIVRGEGDTNEGKVEVVLDADEPEIHALAVDPDGTVWAASSPDGRVYRIPPGAPGTPPEVVIDLDDRWIWSVASDAKGTLYIATGEPARVVKVGPDRTPVVLLETREQHILTLLLARDGTLWAGSAGGGYVYRMRDGAARVALDATGSEVNALAEDADGTLFVASTGAPTAPSAPSASAPANATALIQQGEVTVEAELGADVSPPPPSPTQGSAAAAVTAILPAPGASWIEKVVRDGAPEEFWTSGTENVFALVWSERLLAATGQEGRLLALDSRGRASIVLDLTSSSVTALAAAGNGIVVGTSDRASVLLTSGGLSKKGTYLSPVTDAGHFATWGRISVEHEGDVAIATRSGNAQSPEDHWSEWQSSTGDIASPSARFLQVKLDLRGEASVRSLSVAYLPRNLAPRVRSIEVLANNLALTADAAPENAVSGARSRRSAAAKEAPPTPREEIVSGARSLRWVADDPNQDTLRFAIHYRGEAELEWKLLAEDRVYPFYTLDGTALPDGRYELRVTASDDVANPAKSGLSSELITERILIDNTAPRVTVNANHRGGRVHLSATATDGASAIRWAELSVDGGPWQPFAPADLVLDEREEKFESELEAMSAGEHTAVLRAEDDGGNVGSGKAVWGSRP